MMKNRVCLEDVFLDDCDECVKITIHGVEHYLHQTTTLELYHQIKAYFKGLPQFKKYFLLACGNDFISYLDLDEILRILSIPFRIFKITEYNSLWLRKE